MQQVNSGASGVNVTEIVGGFKVIQTDVSVKRPVFEDVIVKVPVFRDEIIKVPVGFETIVNQLALDIAGALAKQVETIVKDKLDKAIDERISTIRSPKIVEELVIKNKEIEIERPIYRDVDVERPIFRDKEIINPVLVDKEVTNAIIIDKTVVNAIVKDVPMNNAIIKDVEVERAIIREKVIDVIHPRYLKLDGTPE